MPYLDVVATHDPDSKTAALFILNRDLSGPRQLELLWRDVTPTSVKTSQTLTGSDLKAVNTFEQPNRVTPQKMDAPKLGARMTVQVPAKSYTVLALAV